jgi:hypothetical protein
LKASLSDERRDAQTEPSGIPTVARMRIATTSRQFIRQVDVALGISAFVLAATAGGFRGGLLLLIALSAGAFACVPALPAHSLHEAKHEGRMQK